jgi:hypothetical protein
MVLTVQPFEETLQRLKCAESIQKQSAAQTLDLHVNMSCSALQFAP